MRNLNLLTFATLATVVLAVLGFTVSDLAERESPDNFLVKPYLQIGDKPVLTAEESVTVLWHAPDEDADWTMEVKRSPDASWEPVGTPTFRKISVKGSLPRRAYRALLDRLRPGGEFRYRLLRDGKQLFKASARARKAAHQPFRFVAVGDMATGSAGQKKVAYQLYRADPDFVFVTGDIVYPHGRLSEYRSRFFPVYNADKADPAGGAPLLRRVPFIAAPGNHDIGFTNRENVADLDAFPDGLAYFYLWSQPLNGPNGGKPATHNVPRLAGAPAQRAAFFAAAGPNYPQMANFSFDYGNSHWLVLDANDHVNWTDAGMRAWVEQDLAAAADRTWRFVGFHHPPFNSDTTHFNEQQMRMLADIFEKWNVDVVFNGHVHNYQRTFPLKFTMASAPEIFLAGPRGGQIPGKWLLDRSFDGKSMTRPDGVIYLVTGGGGAPLSGRMVEKDRAKWQPFTDRFIAGVHSMTVCDVDGATLTVRQVSEDGLELDSFTISK